MHFVSPFCIGLKAHQSLSSGPFPTPLQAWLHSRSKPKLKSRSAGFWTRPRQTSGRPIIGFLTARHTSPDYFFLSRATWPTQSGDGLFFPSCRFMQVSLTNFQFCQLPPTPSFAIPSPFPFLSSRPLPEFAPDNPQRLFPTCIAAPYCTRRFVLHLGTVFPILPRPHAKASFFPSPSRSCSLCHACYNLIHLFLHGSSNWNVSTSAALDSPRCFQ